MLGKMLDAGDIVVRWLDTIPVCCKEVSSSMMSTQLLELYAQPRQMWGSLDPEKNQRSLSSW